MSTPAALACNRADNQLVQTLSMVMTVMFCLSCLPAAGGADKNQPEQHPAEAHRLWPEAQTEDQRQRDAQGDAESQQIQNPYRNEKISLFMYLSLLMF